MSTSEKEKIEWTCIEPYVWLLLVNCSPKALVIKEAPDVYTGFIFNGWCWLILARKFETENFAKEHLTKIFE